MIKRGTMTFFTFSFNKCLLDMITTHKLSRFDLLLNSTQKRYGKIESIESNNQTDKKNQCGFALKQ